MYAEAPSAALPTSLPFARRSRALFAFLFAVVFVIGLTWTPGDEGYAASIKTPPDGRADMAVVSLASLGYPAKERADIPAPLDAGTPITPSGEKAVAAPARATPATNPWMPAPFSLRRAHTMLRTMTARLAGLARSGRNAAHRPKPLRKVAAVYHAVLNRIALAQLPRIRDEAVLTQSVIVGTASTYNPYRDGFKEGGAQTASGEFYDAEAWTAAIQIGLRAKCGGVRYGRLYRAAYALVESGGKQLIVKINDVGPLKPGRVIDLNERSMRYFDPLMRRGLLNDATVTLLPGADWTPGPVHTAPLVAVASIP